MQIRSASLRPGNKFYYLLPVKLFTCVCTYVYWNVPTGRSPILYQSEIVLCCLFGANVCLLLVMASFFKLLYFTAFPSHAIIICNLLNLIYAGHYISSYFSPRTEPVFGFEHTRLPLQLIEIKSLTLIAAVWTASSCHHKHSQFKESWFNRSWALCWKSGHSRNEGRRCG